MWRKQQERKPHNQDLEAAPAWMISFGHVELVPGALPRFVFERAAANSATVKSPKTLTSVAIGALFFILTDWD